MQLQKTAEATANLARTWITEASQTGLAINMCFWAHLNYACIKIEIIGADILNEAGGMPTTNDPERFSFWVLYLPLANIEES